MDEKPIFFLAGHLKLEGLLHSTSGARGVVITHPHPLYGGDMHNTVVEAIARAYQRQGYTTLRFNFRGVGASQGTYDQGRGEQEDVRAALRYLAEHGKAAVDLVGYSFGAWVNALANPAATVRQMIMVSPPVAFLEFRNLPMLPPLRLVITGDHDSFAPVSLIQNLLADWNPAARLVVLEGAGHFFEGYTDKLEAMLDAHVATG